MRKLYRKGAVHPTPSVVSDQLLSFLPAAILTLTAALTPGDREVLAYLISCSSGVFSNTHRNNTQKPGAPGGSKGGDVHPAGGSKGGDVHPPGGSKGSDVHTPCFNCNCFRCYMSYWVRWDSSPNRQLIHEIIDAFEDSLLKESKKEKNKKERRKGKTVKENISLVLDEPMKSELGNLPKDDFNLVDSNTTAAAAENVGDTIGGGGDEQDSVEEEDLEKGSVRKFVSFLGERIWSVWG